MGYVWCGHAGELSGELELDGCRLVVGCRTVGEARGYVVEGGGHVVLEWPVWGVVVSDELGVGVPPGVLCGGREDTVVRGDYGM